MKKKILIIKLSSLGDVIFNIPLANLLKKSGYEVHWLTSEKGVTVLSNNSCIDKLMIVPIEKWKKEKCFIKNIVEFISIIRALRKEHFDIAFDTQMRLKSLFFLKFCGAKRRIISKDEKEFSILGANEVIPRIKDNNHVVRGYLKFAEYIGIISDEIILSLPDYSKDTIDFLENLKKVLDISKKTIVIAPATTWIGKHWNKDNWKILIENLGNNYNLIYTGTENDCELIEYIRCGNGINLAGKTTLKELIELFKNVDLVISLDSGTTHLAWASQVPKILSIYCATPKTLYAPLGDNNKYIALQADNCIPCHHKKCPKNNEKYICTYKPEVDVVLNKIYELLK